MKDFNKLEIEVQEQIRLKYPRGFEKFLIRFKNHKRKFVSALPFETEDKYYMAKMSLEEARRIILDDEDFNERGVLKSEVKERLEIKFAVDDSNSYDNMDE